MALIDLLIVFTGWILWVMPFLIFRMNSASPRQRDCNARWGIAMQSLAYPIVWIAPFSGGLPQGWQTILSVAFLLIAGLFSWTARLALGKQWRFDAALNSDHELVRRGPYCLVRHPIYTSMFFLLFGTGFMLSPFLLLVCSILLFAIGTQIRVGAEEKLLATQFGEQFQDYGRTVSAYIPFLKFAPKAGQSADR